MRYKTVAPLVASLILVAVGTCPPALAKPPAITLDAWARDSALVVDAKAIRVDGTPGRFEILQVLKGTYREKELSAAPFETHSFVGPREQAPFPAGTEVVLFLGQAEKDVLPVVGNGVAYLQLAPQRREEILGAVTKVVEIEGLPSPEAHMKAYLEAVGGENATLREVARQVITRELHGKDKAAPWEDRLVALIGSPVLEARLAAIQALQFSKSEKALPALLEAVGHENRTVRECASMALVPYDSEVTVRRLLDAATGRPDMVPRVIIDLRGSRRPEAREALVGFLHSENPEIRRYAAGSFYDAIFKGDPVILEIHILVNDPDPEVRVTALGALHKSPLPETVGVLAGALRRHDVKPQELRAAVISLSTISGEVTNHKELRPAFRGVQDLPALMEKALGGDQKGATPPLGHAVVMILGASGTPEATALLLRIQQGEFGGEFVEEARRTLQYLGGG